MSTVRSAVDIVNTCNHYLRVTTNDDTDTVPVTVRLPKPLYAWLEAQRAALREHQGFDVSVQVVIKKHLEDVKRAHTNSALRPKKARTAT